ncbi:MAG: DNA primase [Candidatus Moraniibacteriota bacterium]
MASLVEEVKDRLDIVEVISGYVKMTPAGTNMRGLCPFHREKTPSFMVSREKQIFHCFGCGKGGDVITFIEEMEGMEFKEALRMLAERAGLDYRKYQGAGDNKAQADSKEVLRRVLEASAGFFENNLKSTAGKKARGYLNERGLKEEMAKNFRLGYAPPTGEKGTPSALFDHLKGLGYNNQAILGSGSVYKKDNYEVFVDRFRGRLIFPVADSLGRVVGFSARLLPGDESNQGKYINTPGTALYDKGSLLYGFHLAKAGIRENGEAVMLEGNLDVIMSHQAGITQAVATCGTALGVKQLTFLRRYTGKIILAFDADLAGVKATKRAAELAWEQDLDVKTIPLKAGTDAADIASADPEKWRNMVNKKKSVAGFFFDLAFKKRVLNLEQKKVLADKILKLLAKIPSRVEQSHYLKKLAEEVKVPEALLWEKIPRSKDAAGDKNFKGRYSNTITSRGRRVLLEERLVGLIYNYPKLYFKYLENAERAVFASGEMESLWKEMKAYLDSLPEDKKNTLKSTDFLFSSRALGLKAKEYAVAVENELGDDPDENMEKSQHEAKNCFNILEVEYLKEKRAQMLTEIKKLSGKEKKKLPDLMKRLQDISQEITKNRDT